MTAIKLFVFDMAGTTVQDSGEVLEAFTSAFAHHGIALQHEQISNVRGSSKRQAIRELLSERDRRVELAEVIYETFVDSLRELYGRKGVVAIDGAEQVFERLRQQGVKVVLNTGFDRDITSLLLDVLQWNKATVDAVVCGDDVARGRPAPDLIFRAMEVAGVGDPQQVANVGDTVLDLQAGNAAGVKLNIGVLTGAHDRVRMSGISHTHILDSVKDLLTFRAVENGCSG